MNKKRSKIPSNIRALLLKEPPKRFFDPFLVVVDASRNYEARDTVIDMDKNNYLLFVVHIQQENDMIRIISARQATRQERIYYEN